LASAHEVVPRRTTATAVADALIANGLDTLFCLPGVQNDVFFAELYEYRDRLRLIHTRHEQGAAYMALGAAMATGKPASYCVIPGPGLLNTTAALATAYACNAPVLALTSQIPQAQIGRGHGFLHETPDQLGIIRRLTKWAERIRTPDDAWPLVTEAFRQMRSGRPRPVGLECPIDVWGQSADVVYTPTSTVHRPAVDKPSVERAVRLLRNAKRPVVVAGGGAQHAGAAITRLAELLQSPVIAGQMGFGVVDSRHPLSVNLQVGRTLWRDADVVLAVGTRLQPQQMVWGLDEHIEIIRIDIDPDEIDRFRKPAVSIRADALDAVTALLEELSGPAVAGNGQEDAVRKSRAAFAGEIAALEPQFTYLRALRAAIPEHGILVDEVTQIGHAARFGYPVYHPRTFISPGYQGTLGWGLATAIGVKVARPVVPVVSISGDGGFMFNVAELATMMQHRVAVIMVVFDDGGYGNVRRSQELRFGNRVHVSNLTNPDFVKLSQSFGIKARTVDSAAELQRVLAAFVTAEEPALIHVPVGPMPDPWKFVDQPRVRG
jgi:acetolactate synthase-1/2/3 large subunit